MQRRRKKVGAEEVVLLNFSQHLTSGSVSSCIGSKINNSTYNGKMFEDNPKKWK